VGCTFCFAGLWQIEYRTFPLCALTDPLHSIMVCWRCLLPFNAIILPVVARVQEGYSQPQPEDDALLNENMVGLTAAGCAIPAWIPWDYGAQLVMKQAG
jgi:hypothetical protein